MMPSSIVEPDAIYATFPGQLIHFERPVSRSCNRYYQTGKEENGRSAHSQRGRKKTPRSMRTGAFHRETVQAEA
jgi:hypothetical protein